MDSYDFWRDVLDTYRALPDGIKALWLIVPPAFVLGLVALGMGLGIARRRADHGFTDTLIYSIYRDEDDRYHVVRHAHGIAGQPTLMVLDPSDDGPRAP